MDPCSSTLPNQFDVRQIAEYAPQSTVAINGACGKVSGASLKMIRAGNTPYGPVELRTSVTAVDVDRSAEPQSRRFEHIADKAVDIADDMRRRSVVDIHA